jgi:DnaK suppressor protein
MDAPLQPFAQRIAQELDGLAQALAEVSQDASAVTLDQTSVGRLSRMDAMQQQAMAQERQHRMRLHQRQLQAAQDRVANGTYGRCCECDEDIDLPRLERDPAVVFCLPCQRARTGA